MRIIAGTLFGAASPVRTSQPDCSMPMRCWRRAPSCRSTPTTTNARSTSSPARSTLPATRSATGRLLVFRPATASPSGARADARFLLLGGEPMDGPRQSGGISSLRARTVSSRPRPIGGPALSTAFRATASSFPCRTGCPAIDRSDNLDPLTSDMIVPSFGGTAVQRCLFSREVRESLHRAISQGLGTDEAAGGIRRGRRCPPACDHDIIERLLADERTPLRRARAAAKLAGPVRPLNKNESPAGARTSARRGARFSGRVDRSWQRRPSSGLRLYSLGRVATLSSFLFIAGSNVATSRRSISSRSVKIDGASSTST